jgi:hypothetical protein
MTEMLDAILPGSRWKAFLLRAALNGGPSSIQCGRASAIVAAVTLISRQTGIWRKRTSIRIPPHHLRTVGRYARANRCQANLRSDRRFTESDFGCGTAYFTSHLSGGFWAAFAPAIAFWMTASCSSAAASAGLTAPRLLHLGSVRCSALNMAIVIGMGSQP